MDKYPREVFRAFLALEDDPDFQVILGWLEQRLAQTRATNDKQAIEHLVRWGQGRAQELTDILDAKVQAKEAFRRAVNR